MNINTSSVSNPVALPGAQSGPKATDAAGQQDAQVHSTAAVPANGTPVTRSPSLPLDSAVPANIALQLQQGAASSSATARVNSTGQAGTPALELSGAKWVSRFPTSASVEALTPNFKSSVNSFIGAIKTAGGSVKISATYRPAERAYLMHYAWQIAHGAIKPSDVPAMAGVNIKWDHGDAKASKQAAADMVKAYGIVYKPSLTTNHAQKTAIDMTISGVIGKKVKNKDGKEIEIKKLSDLNAVGATYGVYKLVSDPPHWSANGR
jgi:hypothetical protein